MKVNFLFFLIFIVSCGRIDPISQGTLSGLSNEIVSFSPEQLLPGEVSKISQICSAIAQKSTYLNLLENTTGTFSYSDKSCANSNMSVSQDVLYVIQNKTFKVATTGVPFIFSDIETTDVGVMKDICNSLSSLQSPMQSATLGTIWFTTNVPGSDCQATSEYGCIQIERGTQVNGSQFQKTTKEIIRFKLNGDKLGYFTDRKLISSLSCGINQFLVRHAKLK